jgi:hypothetical protein
MNAVTTALRVREYDGRVTAPAAGGGDGKMVGESVHGLLHGTPKRSDGASAATAVLARCRRLASRGPESSECVLPTHLINRPGLKLYEYDQII